MLPRKTAMPKITPCLEKPGYADSIEISGRWGETVVQRVNDQLIEIRTHEGVIRIMADAPLRAVYEDKA